MRKKIKLYYIWERELPFIIIPTIFVEEYNTIFDDKVFSIGFYFLKFLFSIEFLIK